MKSEKWKTIDGERTRVDEMNVGAEPDADSGTGLSGRLKRFARNASLVMAGMYTGLNCYGTPNTEHEQDDESEQKPDRRPI